MDISVQRDLGWFPSPCLPGLTLSLTSVLAVLARFCQFRITSWQPWIPWQDSY